MGQAISPPSVESNYVKEHCDLLIYYHQPFIISYGGNAVLLWRFIRLAVVWYAAWVATEPGNKIV